MSEIGLYSGLYTRLRVHAELLDRVLINLKTGNSQPSDEDRQKLARLLIALSKSTSDDFSTQLLAILLRDADKSNLAEWGKVGRTLLSTEIQPDIIVKLEKLANILEYERAHTFTRMRGGYA